MFSLICIYIMKFLTWKIKLSTYFFFSWKQLCESNYVKKIVLCKIQNVEMRNRNTTRKECWFALHNFTLCTNRWGESVPTMWFWQWDEIEVIPPARCALSRVWPKKICVFGPKVCIKIYKSIKFFLKFPLLFIKNKTVGEKSKWYTYVI